MILISGKCVLIINRELICESNDCYSPGFIFKTTPFSEYLIEFNKKGQMMIKKRETKKNVTTGSIPKVRKAVKSVQKPANRKK